MEKLLTADIVVMIDEMAKLIIEKEVEFCELDSFAGDGDFGMSLAKGFRQLKLEWEELPQEEIGEFLKACGMVIIEHCGGASGPIWGSAFRSAAKYAKGRTELSGLELAELLEHAAEGIQKRGGAKLGDKTLLDALIPAAEAQRKSAENGEELLTSMRKGAEAAVQGAEHTKDIIASKGRASYVGERSLSHPDAGATAIGILFTGIVDRMQR